jgi:nitrate/nitrite-specific signal transduction histidine kinase
MVDDAGQVVAHANPSVVLGGTGVDLPAENAFTDGIDGTDVALAVQPISFGDQDFTVVAELPQSEATALATNNLTTTIIVVAVAIGAAVIFGAFIANLIATPVGQLAVAAESVSAGDFTQQVEVKTQDEIGVLARAFNSMTNQLRDLIGSLESQVVSRTRALETSTEVSRRLSTILDQDTLVREVVEQLTSAFDYYHAHIYLFDERKQNLMMVGGTGDAGRSMLASGHKIEPGRGLVGRAAASNEIVLIPDVFQAEGWLPNPLLPDTKAEVAVPIAVGTEVLGILDVQHNVTDGLGEQDAALIQSIANQVGIAVQNAQTYQRTQRQAVREARITAINQRIQSAATIDDVLQIAVSELGQALDTQQASIELQVGSQSDNGQN